LVRCASLPCFLVIAALALGGALPAIAQTPYQGVLSFKVSCDADDRDNSSAVEGWGTDAWVSGLVRNLTAGASASAVAESGASVSTGAFGNATWLSPAEGVVSFFDIGWEADGVVSGNALAYQGTDWYYQFRATADGWLEIDYEMAGRGTELFGLNGFELELQGPGYWKFLSLASEPVGSLQYPLVDGATYGLKIKNWANIYGYLGSRTSYMDATFRWRITGGQPIPEPGALAMAGALGVAGLGWAPRRRRT